MTPKTQDSQTGSPLVERYFSTDRDEGHGWDAGVVWTRRTARAGDFVMEDVEAPEFWSDNAVGVTAKLYFATVDGVRETSVRQMIERVAYKIAREGNKHGYFECEKDKGTLLQGESKIFYDELCYLLVHQMASFNTPVWLNVGVPGRKQVCSACFLLGVEDTMLGDHSIMDWIQTEAAIFKGGAGSGASLSKLRASMESLSTGGTASGPTSYMRSADANAGTLKSGGAHRRAAKMVGLDVDHPDIADFVDFKRREDRRMRIMLEAGEDMDPFTESGEKTIAEATSGQNSNNSITTTDEFMRRATDGVKIDGRTTHHWPLIARTTGETVRTVSAPALLDDIADAAWTCGDPGMIFIDRSNEWHTTPVLRGQPSPVRITNPCGEVHQNDDSACNLASLNLVRFLSDHGQLDVERFRSAIDVMILAMDITCSFSELPTPEIERNVRELRQLGLGYANLGGMLMRMALPYDSDEGRDVAASVTALMTGRAYRRSAEIASKMGVYARFEENEGAHRAVIDKHIESFPLFDEERTTGTASSWDAAEIDWRQAQGISQQHGYRNSQVTVIAPTGTISIKMDCDTSGCEPEFSLVRHKGIAGGGAMTFVTKSATIAAQRLGGYSEENLKQLAKGDISCIEKEDLPVFACANDISVDGHVRMVAAIQPFLSGAPSKTINLPESATREDVRDAYVLAWRLGCKCISIYRDGSKVTQVLSSKPKAVIGLQKLRASVEDLHSIPTTEPGGQPQEPYRRRLARERESLTYKLSVDGHEGYVTAGTYEEGDLGEIFLTGVGKEGSFLQGMMGAWSIAVSIGLQYGVPLEVFAAKFIGMEFEPRGFTADPNIPEVKSIPDYVFRWLASHHLDADECEELGVLTREVKQRMAERLDSLASVDERTQGLLQERASIYSDPSTGLTAAESAKKFFEETGLIEHHPRTPGNGHARERGTKPCSCGGLMRATGTCYTCQSCGRNTGCG